MRRRLRFADAKRRLIEQEKKLLDYRKSHAGQMPSQMQGNLQAMGHLGGNLITAEFKKIAAVGTEGSAHARSFFVNGYFACIRSPSSCKTFSRHSPERP